MDRLDILFWIKIFYLIIHIEKYFILLKLKNFNIELYYELNCPKYNEPIKFEESFKQALLTVIRLDNVNCFIVINDH